MNIMCIYIYEAFKNSRTIHLILMKNVKKKIFLINFMI